MSAPIPEWVATWVLIAGGWICVRGLVRDWLFDRKRGKR